MTKRSRLLLIPILMIGLLLVYLLCWPVPISPLAWNPPPAPELTGPYQQNSNLAGVEHLQLVPPGTGFAPEDVALDKEGRIYAGLDDGRIMRIKSDGSGAEVFANTNGRPLGLIFDAAGNLIVADANEGLLSITPGGEVSVLTRAADGIPFRCANDLDVAADGTIYFTDASHKFPLSNYKADLLEHRGNGRLLAYDPKSKTTRALLKDLIFANGVAVSPDQTFVLVAETGVYRVHRVWLSGPRQGQSEIFIDNLPGFPDGILSNGRDKFWLALVSPRDKTLDKLMAYPSLRKVIVRLPAFLQPAPKRFSFVLGLDLEGRVVANLQDGSPECYAQIANVVERNGFLYFGSIGESTVGRFRLPQ
ncbi:MAG TPA: SMP-30/gluconolactonase/LRE family protein [Pyrinomonadaceae bacterium]|nr:SMP-30/gluconolactonase/LRE family protein [Pyrinomonadaceae bacterium]